MITKIIEPFAFGFLFVVLFWFSERNKNPEHKVDHEKMRYWVAFATWMACAEFASTWHNEIGSAWQNHPDLTLVGTLIVFAILNAVAQPLQRFLTMLPDNGARQHSQARVP
jgi:hypothetical protein